VWALTPDGVSGVFRATPAVDEENNIYLGTKANKESVFYAIKADGSGLLWKNPVGADLYSSPALGADHILYVGSEWSSDGQIHLHALTLQTGTEVWSASLAADVTWCSPALTDNGLLYIGNMAGDEEGGTLYCLRTDSPGLLTAAGSPRFHEGNTSTGRRD
ncbi:MAG: PQQ-binding-like beta-propeller repeat protein, partial [Calditrichota bacterium]